MKVHLRYDFVLVLLLFFYSCKTKSVLYETDVENRKIVEMVTNYGTLTMELYNETPLHRDNFLKLVNEKVYDSLLFHRVIENFMIQGGDPDSRRATAEDVLGDGDLGYTIEPEFHPDLFHKKGALATAREDGPSRVSSASQFYIAQGKIHNDSLLDRAQSRINKMLARHYTINDPAYKPLYEAFQKAIKEENMNQYRKLNDSIDLVAESYNDFERYTIPPSHREVYKTIGGTPHLDQNYTVFGQVIEGLDVLDSIAGTPTGEMDRPISEVRIRSVRLKN